LSTLTASNSSDAAHTGTWETVLADLEELAHQVQLGAASRPFFVAPSPVVKMLARLAWQNGIDSVGLDGGEILGVPLLVSDGMSSGKILLVDASNVAVAERPIELRSSEEAALEMADDPSGASDTPTAANLVSLYQVNALALLAERQCGLKLLRVTAAATLSNFGSLRLRHARMDTHLSMELRRQARILVGGKRTWAEGRNGISTATADRRTNRTHCQD
jgi:hypothetical protein